MTTSISKPLVAATLAILSCGLSGCCLLKPGARHAELSASQLRSQELFAENEQLMMAKQQTTQSLAGIDAERQMLAQQLGEMQNQLSTANSRIDNLLAERTDIKDRYTSLLTDNTADPILGGVPMVPTTVPGFQLDELTGLSKFPEDILFDLGSAELRPEAYSVLNEFANQAKSGGADGLRILVVGHTDDQVIRGGNTAAQHPTNWHLSTDRADRVILELEKLGVSSSRIASMGYSKYQPLSTSIDEATRQRNRRVEMYLVPDAANLAMWDPVRSLN